MGHPKLSIELAQEAVNAMNTYGAQTKAAEALGMSRGTLEVRLRAAKLYGLVPRIEAAGSPASLKMEIARLKTQLRLAESKGGELESIKGVIGSLTLKISEIEPPEWLLNPQRKESAPGVPTLFLSDLHWGEVVHPSQINGVNTYNVSIAKERLQTCVDASLQLLRIISPKMDYPGVVLALGGDMISGNIHDELTATNEINSMPAVLDLYGALVGVVTQLANTFGRVFIPCVSGNHGRDTKKIWTKDRHHTSFDWLLYQFLAKHFQNDKRIVFFVPDGPDAYYRIYGTRYLLTHGDQFRGGDGVIGALGPIIRGDHRKRSRNAQVDMEYDTMLCGHWHQYIHMERLIVNGSLKGYDEYAYSNNFPFESPRQALWLTHPKRGLTFRMPVYVDRQRAAPKTAWVSFAA